MHSVCLNQFTDKKALCLAVMLGKETLKEIVFEKRNDFILKQFENMKLNT